LAEVEVMADAIVMVNIVGNAEGEDPAEFVSDHHLPGLHLYGKTARPARKLGHLTLLGSEVATVRSAAWQAVTDLHGGLA
jgi:5-(carboxyamino)imidazole ribonucleotide synthase